MEAITHALQSAGLFLAFLAGRFAILLAVLALLAVVFFVGLAVVRAVGALRARALGLTQVAGLRWRGAASYASAHTWLADSNGQSRVGIDDLAERLLGKITGVVLPHPGTVLHRGDPAVELHSGARRAVLPSPVSGTVTAINTRVARRPGAINADPYVGGWLYALAEADLAGAALRRGDEARRWFAEESARLTHAFEGELGLAAADGGELVGPAPSLIPDDRWDRLVREFLQAR